jgi:hypothetical protein
MAKEEFDFEEIGAGDIVKFEDEPFSFIGELLDKSESIGKFGPQLKCEFLDKEDDEVKIFYTTSILEEKMNRVEVGDVFKLEYLGLKDNKAKTAQYKDFKVSVAKK